jgi:circadian clock protein KaiC
MGHSNQVREFMVTNHGIQLTDVYIGPIAALRAEFSGEEAIITRTVSKDKLREAALALDEAAMGRSRKGDAIECRTFRRR